MACTRQTLFTVAVMCVTCNIIVTTSDQSVSSLTEESDDTGINRKADKNEDADKATTTIETSIVDPYNDMPSKVKVSSDKQKFRSKRSVNSNATATATRMKTEDEIANENLMRMREATSRLTKYLRSLPVSQEHTIPYIYMRGYDAKVPLNIGVKVLNVVEINDVKQTIKTGLYITLQWQDKALAWNMSLYENVDTVDISPTSIWTPPIFVPNSRSLEDILEKTKAVMVTHEGKITAISALFLETSCAMDLSLYPFDEQTCAIKFFTQPWLFHWIVDANASDRNLSKSLALNSEWELMTVSTRLYLESGENPNPEVRVRLRRKTRFYSVCLILPMVVTSYMNTLVFLVPLQSGEKISFLVTLFVSTSVFTSFFSTTMPRGLDKMPVSMKLLVGVIVESLLVLLATLLVLRKLHAEQEASAVFSCHRRKDSKYSATMAVTYSDFAPTSAETEGQPDRLSKDVMKTNSIPATFRDNIRNTAKPNARDNEHTDIRMRKKRSASADATGSLNNNTAGADKGNEKANVKNLLKRRRVATASVTEQMRSLSVSREQAMPLTYTEESGIKIPLHLTVTVQAILDVSDIYQTMKTSLYVSITWRDEALAWNVSLYEGVQFVVIPSPGFIWTPRIYIPNSINRIELLGDAQYITVRSNGQVTIESPVVLESSCPMDLTWYPYDEQTCTIQFLVILKDCLWRVEEKAVDDSTESLALNSEWEVVERFNRIYLHAGDPHPEVAVKLRRKTTFYSVCLVMPMVVTSYISVLVFLIPPETGEKLSFLVTLCVSTSVHLSFFTTTMPRGLESVPVSTKLLIGVIVESVLVLLATLLVLRTFHTEQEASAVPDTVTISGGQEKGSMNRVSSMENHSGPPSESGDSVSTDSTELPRPQSPHSLRSDAPASRAMEPCCLIRTATSRQLDRILFIAFLAGNSIFLLALLLSVRYT